MSRLRFRLGVILLALVAIQSRAWAAPITIDFDNLQEFDAVTNQFAGLTFANATVLAAGSSLNDLEFPPHSGANVILDDAGPISIAFAAPIFSLSGFFTYLSPLTITAFDGTDNLLGSVTSTFLTNLALSGNPGSTSNELLALAFQTGISRVSIAADPSGGSFVLDDLTFDHAPAPSSVPEPGTLSLMGLGVAMLFRKARAVKRRTAERATCG
jgi:hypothetical protein